MESMSLLITVSFPADIAGRGEGTEACFWMFAMPWHSAGVYVKYVRTFRP